jgi:hypothetical protein
MPVLSFAQQFRQSPPANAFQRAIERHLESKEPQFNAADPSKPIPGKFLLDRSSKRLQFLKQRIRESSKVGPLPFNTAPTATVPGIQFRDSLPAGVIANSVVAGDFNQDGHPDFIVANGATDDLWIYFGKGDGTFDLPQVIPLTKGQTPVYLATADLRGTGKLDLVVAEFDTATIGVFLGNGDGSFGFEQIYSLPQPPSALTLGDFNRDGKVDIVAVMQATDPFGPPALIATLFGDGQGSFSAPVVTNVGFISTATAIASGDVNNDGLPDLIVTGPGLENSQIYVNAGAGIFTPGQIIARNDPVLGDVMFDAQIADLNGDGCNDVAVADGNSDALISFGDCAGNFSPNNVVPMGDEMFSLRLLDINGDGHLDIVTTGFPLFEDPSLGNTTGNSLCVAFGDGLGNFTSGRTYMGTGLSYSQSEADFNGDGKLDVVTVSPDTDTASVYLNDGSGGFGFPQGEWIGSPGAHAINSFISAPSFVDVNNDGSPDIVIVNQGLNGESFITSALNDRTGRFSAPISSDIGTTDTTTRLGDYRLGDFRNTGRQDFLAIGLSTAYGGTPLILFARGNGDGSFGNATISTAPGADGELAVGDFDHDGKLDFMAVGPNSTGNGKVLTIFLGNGDGTFRNTGTVAFADSAQDISRVFAADLNRDGKLDILVYTTGNGYWTTNTSVWEFLGNGDGTFKPGQQLFTPFQPMTLADVNGDSWLDLVRYDFQWPDGLTETEGPAKFTTYLGQPTGTFALSSSYAPYNGIPRDSKPYLQMGDPLDSGMVADLNGDGKPDEIAFQLVSPPEFTAYAQILMGNGDGTFTPTYNVYNFNKDYSFPEFAYHLDTSGRSDLIELDGASSAINVYKGANAPAIQIALEEEQIKGTSGCGWVFLNVPSVSDSAILLSSSVAGVSIPTSVTVPAGSLSSQFCFTLDPSFNWHQVFDIQAQLGTDKAVAYASQAYVFGFAEQLSSNSQVLYPGQSSSPVTITLNSSQGYTSTVHLSCENLPSGATCAFANDTLSITPGVPSTTSVVINTGLDHAIGTFAVTIAAGDAQVVKRQSFNLTFQSLFVTPIGSTAQLSSPGADTTSLAISINGIPPYNPSCSGLPVGISCAFNGNQVPFPGATFLQLGLTASAGIAPGAYPFTATVTSGPATASIPFTLDVTGFNIQLANPSASWAPPGATANVGINLQPIGPLNMGGTITCSTDFGGTCTGQAFPPSNAPQAINLSLTIPADTAVGSHTLTVTAADGSLHQTATFPFAIADYSGSLSTSTLSLKQGSSGTFTATINATAGFTDSVSLACSGSAAIACSFEPSTVSPTASNPATVTVTVSATSLASVHYSIGSKQGLPLLALILPLGLIFRVRRRLSTRFHSVILIVILSVSVLSLSCGGNSNTGGSGGTNSISYQMNLTASAAGTNATRSLGTITVTVTH